MSSPAASKSAAMAQASKVAEAKAEQSVNAALIAHGAPYPQVTAILGGFPNVSVDVAIIVVFMLFFMGGFACHAWIFRTNWQRRHRFVMSALMSGFCMERIITCILRIVWACYPKSVQLAIAQQVFVAAGVILLFITDIIFTQRILRALHPSAGWHRWLGNFPHALNALIVVSLIMQLTTAIQSFYTLNDNTHKIDKDFQLYGNTLNAFVAFLPIPIVIASLLVPRSHRVEKFGEGRFRSKLFILLAGATLLSTGAIFRCVIEYLPSHIRTMPPWYDDRACFYCFQFLIELFVVLLYAIVRVDKRFHIPNGAKGAGSYSGRMLEEKGNESSPERFASQDGTEGGPRYSGLEPTHQTTSGV
ncbi:hypothetical protein MMC12_008160 [Toensbergia leucococca]|nr:hypothetical protein [Toensbergia leucococca]